jgi:uncharacterized damage-inducible protein DinB
VTFKAIASTNVASFRFCFIFEKFVQVNLMKELLCSQYQFTREARSVLMKYCATISQDDFVRSYPQIGNGGSIRNLLVHINNSYHGWLKKFAFSEPFQKPAFTDMLTLKDCADYFQLTDELVAKFLSHFDNRYYEKLQGELASRIFHTTPLEVFTHVVTHEFHHKGQILVLGRMWGYEPVDTDVLR